MVGLVVVAGLVGGGRTAEVVVDRPTPGPTCTPAPVMVFLPMVQRAEMPTVRPTVGPPATMRPTLGPTVEIDGQ